MELQLGLALPTTPFSPFGYELKQGPFHNNGSCSSSSSSSGGSNKRRGGFDEDTRVVPKTLRLLLWNTNQRNGEDDDPNDLDDHSSSAILKNGGEGLVGWPPVKAWRKKLRRHVHNGRANNNRMAAAAAGNNSCGGRAFSNSTYVKVKMEGNAIARKIDLSVHRSFESLTSTLKRMFDISEEQWRKSFKLAYQDREGDWLLAEDVPWRTFIRSLKCIKLVRS
ncbi:indole-3-acetic acid inducible 29 [Hibiscus trionum]|uniref:Auxin-responsive protein n=1 Tax=Hibiscus trionum TaxID=183268 RepID=A0A9W7I4H6_HIBTR|nr:indole-3-acetic acid inducible 29 [Hibiscus trionum]